MMVLDKNNCASVVADWFGKTVIPVPVLSKNSTDLFATAVAKFRTDHERYFPGEPMDVARILLRPEIQGILLYRIAREFFLAGNNACDHFAALGRVLSGFELYYSAEIGEGMKINHGMGMVIGARSVIGKNVLLHHAVTLGDKAGGRPVLGDHVTLYPGAMVLGNITIGNRVVIAANAVCMENVEDDVTVAGIPAKPIHKK